MNTNFDKVKTYLQDLDYLITFENEEDGVLVIENEERGIKNLVVGVADPILILEQYIFELHGNNKDVLLQLLIKNRDIVHGAFALDSEGKKVIFRDTLQLENLDLNEVEGTLNSLELLLAEYSDEIIKFSKN